MRTEVGVEKCARNFGRETCSEDVTNRAKCIWEALCMLGRFTGRGETQLRS